ncbi:MAG: YncE family protein [Thermodesulfobacteriota bacterium]
MTRHISKFILLVGLLLYPKGALSVDYIYVTSSDANVVSVIDSSRGMVIREIPVGDEPCDIAIDSAGRWVAVSHEKRRGEIWFLDRKTLQVQHKTLLIKETKRKTNCFFLAFSKDGGKLYAVNRFSGILYVVDPSAGKVTKTIRLGPKDKQRFGGAVLSPNGRFLYIPNEAGREIIVVDTSRDIRYEVIQVPGIPSEIALSTDGKTLYMTNPENSSLDIMDIATKRIEKQVPVENSPLRVVASPDGRFLYVTNLISYSMSIIDTQQQITVANIPVGAYPIGVAVSADGRSVYVSNYNEDSISVIDTATNRERWRVPTTSTPVMLTVY